MTDGRKEPDTDVVAVQVVLAVAALESHRGFDGRAHSFRRIGNAV